MERPARGPAGLLLDGDRGVRQAGAPGGESLRRELEQGAQAAIDAYADAGRWLSEHYVPRAEEHDPSGSDRYRLALSLFLGTEIDLDETYAWGWERVEPHRAGVRGDGRAHPARREPRRRDRATGEDPECAIEGVDEFRRWMQDLQDRTMAELNGTHFDIPEPVQRIEALIAPPGGALAMYYTGPSEDFSRAGRTWYPTGGKTRFPTWGEVAIAYHEGVPGHHLQIGMTRYLKESSRDRSG